MHTVGPFWRGGSFGEAELLRNCYVNSIEAAVKNDAKTIAFPSISTGVYGYPFEHAANIACGAVKGMLLKYPFEILEKVVFVCFGLKAFEIYKALEVKYFA